MKSLKLILLLLCTLIFFTYSKVMATEEAKYEIIIKNDIYEVRKYLDRLAIETFTTDQSNSFRKLFNYISGGNQKGQKIEMTTPVTRIEKNGIMTMQFYLPKAFDKNNVPIPVRQDLKIVTIEGGHYAVLRYSGRASDSNFIKHKNILEKELLRDNISIISSPIRATYDSPFTLPMNRRNEAMFKVNY